MRILVQDFTGIYDEQPFMQELRQKAAAQSNKNIQWLDCTKIIGTDCYCDDDAVKAINKLIDDTEKSPEIPDILHKTIPGIHFFDNGNYHYMSKLWTDRVQEPFDLIVFDHHPDMQPPRFGGILSCGGWVLEALVNNPFIQSTVIIGVADHLVEEVRNELSQSDNAKILNKVTFICESELKRLPSLIEQHSSTQPLYISIDKDALAHDHAATNWDQGSLTLDALQKSITSIVANRKILGIDICGERSRDFEGDTNHTVQEADRLNDALNRHLLNFLQGLAL